MAKHKRGKLRSVHIRPMYDEKEKPTGYTVSAEHDPAETGKDSPSYLPPVESPHETKESALAKAAQHLGGGAAPEYDDDADDQKPTKPMRKAFGRPGR